MLGVEPPETVSPRGMLHSSVVAHISFGSSRSVCRTTGSIGTSPIKVWSSVEV